MARRTANARASHAALRERHAGGRPGAGSPDELLADRRAPSRIDRTVVTAGSSAGSREMPARGRKLTISGGRRRLAASAFAASDGCGLGGRLDLEDDRGVRRRRRGGRGGLRRRRRPEQRRRRRRRGGRLELDRVLRRRCRLARGGRRSRPACSRRACCSRGCRSTACSQGRARCSPAWCPPPASRRASSRAPSRPVWRRVRRRGLTCRCARSRSLWSGVVRGRRLGGGGLGRRRAAQPPRRTQAVPARAQPQQSRQTRRRDA